MTAIYHITNVRNLPSIIQREGLCCDNTVTGQNIDHVNIAYGGIKARRAVRPVRISPGGTLADYVPFYFAPRSPMLYAIHKGLIEGYDEGQKTIVYLVSSVEGVSGAGSRFCFTDGHAAMAISRFFNKASDLDRVDWEIIRATYWHDTEEDNDRKRRRQAEFLVRKFLPWSMITEIGVMNLEMKDWVRKVLVTATPRLIIGIHRDWYY